MVKRKVVEVVLQKALVQFDLLASKWIAAVVLPRPPVMRDTRVSQLEIVDACYAVGCQEGRIGEI